jgi:hypothetical protein
MYRSPQGTRSPFPTSLGEGASSCSHRVQLTTVNQSCFIYDVKPHIRSYLTALLIALLTAVMTLVVPQQASALQASPAVVKVAPVPTDPGTWTTLDCPGVNPIHAANLPSGNVLMVAGSGYNRATFDANSADPTLKLYKAWIYNPNTPDVCPREVDLPQEVDLFCAGMTHLQDGKLLFFGGTGAYGEPGSFLGSPNYYRGIKDTYVFDEVTESFTKVADMHAARWYGNAPVNSGGNPIAVGGYNEVAQPTTINEMYQPATNTWTQLNPTTVGWPMYAGMAMIPDGRFAYYGTFFGNTNTQLPKVWNWQNNGTALIPGLWAPNCREQAPAVTLYPKVFVIGGGCIGGGATSGVSSLNLTTSPLAFASAPALGYAAQHMCAAALPDKSIFVSGGSVGNENPQLQARRLGFNATAWTALANPMVPRQYHSTCLTLPDGSVLTMGTNYKDGTVEHRMETYHPWYTQPGMTRSTLLTAPATANISAIIPVTYGVAQASSATLTHLESVTHQTDPNGKTVPLTLTQGAAWGQANVTIPGASVTPPGVYKLSLLDWRGVPTEYKTITLLPFGTAKVPPKASGGSVPAAMPCCCC